MLEIFEDIFAPKKKDNTGLILGVAVGTLAAAAAACVTARVVKEVKSDLKEVYFVSANGENIVSITSGSSDFARGLTFIKVKAYKKSGGDECKFAFLSLTGGISCEWKDNENVEFFIGRGKNRPCCEIAFGGDDINLTYYLKKITIEDKGEKEE